MHPSISHFSGNKSYSYFEKVSKWEVQEDDGKKITSTESELTKALSFRVQELEKLNNAMLKDLREANSKLVQFRVSRAPPRNSGYSYRAATETIETLGSNREYSLYKENQELQDKIERLSKHLARTEASQNLMSPSQMEESQKNKEKLLSKLKQANECIYKFLISLQKLQKGALIKDNIHMPTYRKEFDAQKAMLIELSKNLKSFIHSSLSADSKLSEHMTETHSPEIIELKRQLENEMGNSKTSGISLKLEQCKRGGADEEIIILQTQLQKKEQELTELNIQSDTQIKNLQNHIASLKKENTGLQQHKKKLEEQTRKLPLFEKNEQILKKTIFELRESLKNKSEVSKPIVNKIGLNTKLENIKSKVVFLSNKLSAKVFSVNLLHETLKQKIDFLFSSVTSLISKEKEVKDSQLKSIKKLKSQLQILQKFSTEQTSSLENNLSLIKARSEQLAEENNRLHEKLLLSQQSNSKLKEQIISEKELYKENAMKNQKKYEQEIMESKENFEKCRKEFVEIINKYEIQLKKYQVEKKQNVEITEMARKRECIVKNEEWQDIQKKKLEKYINTFQQQFLSLFGKFNERIDTLNNYLQKRKGFINKNLKLLLLDWKEKLRQANINLQNGSKKIMHLEEKIAGIIEKCHCLSLLHKNSNREQSRKFYTKINTFYKIFLQNNLKSLTELDSHIDLENSKIKNLQNRVIEISKQVKENKIKSQNSISQLLKKIENQKQIHEVQKEDLKNKIAELQEINDQQIGKNAESNSTILSLQKQIASYSQEIEQRKLINKMQISEILQSKQKEIKNIYTRIKGGVVKTSSEIEVRFSEKSSKIIQLHSLLRLLQNSYSKQKEALCKSFKVQLNGTILEKNATIKTLQEQIQEIESKHSFLMKEQSQIHKTELDNKISEKNEIENSLQQKINEMERNYITKLQELSQVQEKNLDEQLLEKNRIISELQNIIKENERKYFTQFSEKVNEHKKELNKLLQEKTKDISLLNERIKQITLKYSQLFETPKSELNVMINRQADRIYQLKEKIIELKHTYSEKWKKLNSSYKEEESTQIITAKNSQISELLLQIEQLNKTHAEKYNEIERQFKIRLEEQKKTHMKQIGHIKQKINLIFVEFDKQIIKCNNLIQEKLIAIQALLSQLSLQNLSDILVKKIIKQQRDKLDDKDLEIKNLNKALEEIQSSFHLLEQQLEFTKTQNKKLIAQICTFKTVINRMQNKVKLHCEEVEDKLSKSLAKVTQFFNSIYRINLKIVFQKLQELYDNKLKFEASKKRKEILDMQKELENSYLLQLQNQKEFFTSELQKKQASGSMAIQKFKEIMDNLSQKLQDHNERFSMGIAKQQCQIIELKKKMILISTKHSNTLDEYLHKFDLQIKEKENQIAQLKNQIHSQQSKLTQQLQEIENSYQKELDSQQKFQAETIAKLQKALEDNIQYAQELRNQTLQDTSSLNEGKLQVIKLIDEKAKIEAAWSSKMEQQQIGQEKKIKDLHVKYRNIVSTILLKKTTAITENYRIFFEEINKKLTLFDFKIQKLFLSIPQITDSYTQKINKLKYRFTQFQKQLTSAIKLPLQQFASYMENKIQNIHEAKLSKLLSKIEKIAAILPGVPIKFEKQCKVIQKSSAGKIVFHYSKMIEKYNFICEKYGTKLTKINGVIPQIAETILKQKQKLMNEIVCNKNEILSQKSTNTQAIDGLRSLLKAEKDKNSSLIINRHNLIENIKLSLLKLSAFKIAFENFPKTVSHSLQEYQLLVQEKVAQVQIKSSRLSESLQIEREKSANLQILYDKANGVQKEYLVQKEVIAALEKRLNDNSDLLNSNEERQKLLEAENSQLHTQIEKQKKEIDNLHAFLVSLKIQQKALHPFCVQLKQLFLNLKSGLFPEINNIFLSFIDNIKMIEGKYVGKICFLKKQLSDTNTEIQNLRDSETKFQKELQELNTKLVLANSELQRFSILEQEKLNEEKKYFQLLQDYELDKSNFQSMREIYDKTIAESNQEIVNLKNQLSEEKKKVEYFRTNLESQIEKIKTETEETKNKEISYITNSIREKSKKQKVIYKLLREKLMQFKKWMTQLLEEMRNNIMKKSEKAECMTRERHLQFKKIKVRFRERIKQHFTELINPPAIILEKFVQFQNQLSHLSQNFSSVVKRKIAQIQTSITKQNTKISQQLLVIENLNDKIKQLKISQSSMQITHDSEMSQIEEKFKKIKCELNEKIIAIQAITKEMETAKMNSQSTLLQMRKEVDDKAKEIAKVEEMKKQNDILTKSLVDAQKQIEEIKAENHGGSLLLDLSERKISSSSISSSSAAGRHHSASQISSASEREKMLKNLKAMIMKVIQLIPINKIKTLDQLILPLGSLLGLTKEEIAAMQEERKKAKLDPEPKSSKGFFGF